MRGPYGFEMTENCQTCTLRKNGFFCQLEAAAMKNSTSKSLLCLPRRAVSSSRSKMLAACSVLCEGQVKLSISSSEGKTLILRIAKPGEVLGLTAVVGGTPYEVTAETLRPSQVAFIRRDDFLRFIAEHPRRLPEHREADGHFVRSSVCEQLRTVGSQLPPQKGLPGFCSNGPTTQNKRKPALASPCR